MNSKRTWPASAGDRIIVRFHQIATLGAAHGRYQDVGVFADYGLQGETASMLVERTRGRYLLGRVEEVLEPSPERVAPRCPYFGICGGCQYQHASYKHQLEVKRQLVANHFERILGPEAAEVRPTVAAPTPWRYRNHVRFSVNRQGELGFIQRGGRRFLRVDECHIAHPWIEERQRELQGRCAGLRQVAFRYGERTGEYLVHPRLEERGIQASFASGQPHYHDELLGVRFRVSAPSFFQVHDIQAERLVELVRESLRLSTGETLLDAYAGVGVFAILLAPLAGRVIAVEVAAGALADARVNAAAAGVENLELVQAPVERALPALAERGCRVDAAILDPPRAGCERVVLQQVATLRPARIAYVSCNPATLARDVQRLGELGYRLRHVQPVDMFPQTYHVECLALLTR